MTLISSYKDRCDGNLEELEHFSSRATPAKGQRLEEEKVSIILVTLIHLIGRLPLQIETNYPLTHSTRSRPYAVLPCVEPHSRAE